MEKNKRFIAVSLSFNVGARSVVGQLRTPAEDCNPGGSVICNPGTGGCDGGLTCVGNSCSGSSATKDFNFDSEILVAHEELAALREELATVVRRFATGPADRRG
jgi:hypothetical protein